MSVVEFVLGVLVVVAVPAAGMLLLHLAGRYEHRDGGR